MMRGDKSRYSTRTTYKSRLLLSETSAKPLISLCHLPFCVWHSDSYYFCLPVYLYITLWRTNFVVLIEDSDWSKRLMRP